MFSRLVYALQETVQRNYVNKNNWKIKSISYWCRSCRYALYVTSNWLLVSSACGQLSSFVVEMAI